jgi:hypothetical protein
MAEILPRHYLYGILFFGFIIVSGMMIINEFYKASISSGNNINFDSGNERIGYNQTFNKFSKINETMSSFKSGISISDNDVGLFGVLNGLIQSSWSTLKLLLSSFGFMDDVFVGLSDQFGIPAYIPVFIIMFIMVTIAFAIYSLIFAKDA